MSKRLNKNLRHIFSQYGGGGPSYNPFSPGGISYGKPGGFGNSQINQYYETPLDESIIRLNDVSLQDDTLSVEKRLEIYHDSIEQDIKGYLLKEDDLSGLNKSDRQLLFTKNITHPVTNTKSETKKMDYALEFLLETARTNSSDRHPFEDVSPPQIKPSRRHTMSQIYINRGTGATPFLGFDTQRSPYDVAKYTSPPDGNPRSYPYRDQNEIDAYLRNPQDIDFMSLYGETLAFDHPQDPESKDSGYKVDDIVKKIIEKVSKNGTEQALDLKRKLEELLRLPNGPGKARRMDDFFGDTRDQLQEVMGMADKYPASPNMSVGLGILPFGKA